MENRHLLGLTDSSAPGAQMIFPARDFCPLLGQGIDNAPISFLGMVQWAWR
jgi:hypothetical protein